MAEKLSKEFTPVSEEQLKRLLDKDYDKMCGRAEGEAHEIKQQLEAGSIPARKIVNKDSSEYLKKLAEFLGDSIDVFVESGIVYAKASVKEA